jgi:hypothetical protein
MQHHHINLRACNTITHNDLQDVHKYSHTHSHTLKHKGLARTTHIYIYGLCAVFLAGKSLNIQPRTMYIHGSDQPYSYTHAPPHTYTCTHTYRRSTKSARLLLSVLYLCMQPQQQPARQTKTHPLMHYALRTLSWLLLLLLWGRRLCILLLPVRGLLLWSSLRHGSSCRGMCACMCVCECVSVRKLL